MEKEVDQEQCLSQEMDMIQSQHITPKRAKGGLITMPFIIANEAFEKVASYGLIPNMILYLMRDYKMGITKGTNILFFWTAATNFMPLLGAFVSDSCLGRFLTIALGSFSSLSGMILLWLTTMIPQAKPPRCENPTTTIQSCTEMPRTGQITLLLSSFALMSIGAGGIRPCSLAFGADQFYNKTDLRNDRILESYFNWYYASASISVLIALTGIVYIQDHFGWRIGFGVPAILVFFAALLFLIASPLYVKQKASKSLFTGFAQVVVAAFRNRKVPFPSGDSGGNYYHRERDSGFVVPSKKLRFLNKACIITNPEHDLTPTGSAVNPWSLCTIEKVEELKALIKVIPIWSTGIMLSINISQNSFPLLQASTLNRHITSGFQIPAGSFGMFTIITLAIWVIFYDRAILPLASKIRGKPVRLGVKLRMGLGLLTSCIAMIVTATVENIRRKKAIHEGYLNNPQAVLSMSAGWLVPQHCLNGLAEAFNAIAQTEFYYAEFPKTMSSIASALFMLGMAVANLLASLVFSTVDKVSSRDGKESWVSSNINKGHYDYYYWILAILSGINLLYFLICSWAYGPCVDQVVKVRQEPPGNGMLNGEQELPSLAKIDGPKSLEGEELLKS